MARSRRMRERRRMDRRRSPQPGCVGRARRLSRIAPLCAALVFGACTHPSDVNMGGWGNFAPPGISVTGQGEASGVPDVLLADAGVSIVRPTVAEASAETTRR